jgi:DNA replication protein DnaC
VIEPVTNLARRCSCGIADIRDAELRHRRAGVPPRFVGKTFENFQIKPGDHHRATIVSFARNFANGFTRGYSQGFILRGIPGCGKTHVAVAVLNEVIRRGHSGRYANFSDLLSQIRDTFNNQGDVTEGDLLQAVDEVDLLVLDDLGAESTTDWVRDRLYLIINRRYENARSVIITTNCSEAELAARVGERIASRLCEMCSLQCPEFPAVDWRRAMMR